MDYGFTLKVVDLTSSQMKQIEGAIKNLGGTVQAQTRNIQENFNSIGNSARELKTFLIEAFAVREIYQFGKELLNTTAEFQGFENVIRGSSNGIVEGQENLNYLKDAVDRLHLPMRQAYQGFSEMEAGFYGTTIQGEKLRTVFEGLSEISLTKHLNPDAYSRAVYAMKEIGELGTLQARQLRMLSFSVPGAGQMAAGAMHMTSMQLHEAMKKGQIKAEDFLPKLGEYMQKVAATSLATAGHSLLAQINDEQNAVIKTMLAMGDSLQPLFLDILKTVKGAMEGIKEVWNGLTGNSSFVNALKDIFNIIVKSVPIWISYEVVMGATNLVIASYIGFQEGLTSATIASTVAIEDATAATYGLDTAMLSTGMGAFAIALGVIVEKVVEFNIEFDKTIEKITRYQSTAGKVSPILTSGASIWGAYLNDHGKTALDVNQKGQLLQDAIKNKKLATNTSALDVSGAIGDTQNRISNLTGDISKINKIFSSTGLLGISSDRSKELGDRMLDDIAQKDALNKTLIGLERMPKDLQGRINQSDAIIKDYTQQNKDIIAYNKTHKNKKDLIVIPSEHPLSGTQDGAINTSNLSGASGGLGQAKIIKIDFHGPFQQNNGVRESKNQADAAIEKMVEILNNFSDSQNAM